MLEETRCISSPPPLQVQVVSQTLHWDSTVKRTVWVGGSPEWHLGCSGKPSYCPSDPHYRVCTRHPGLPWSRIHRGIPFRTIWDQESKEKKSSGTREGTEVRPAPLSVRRRRGLGTGPPPLLPTEQVGGDTRLPPPVSFGREVWGGFFLLQRRGFGEGVLHSWEPGDRH